LSILFWGFLFIVVLQRLLELIRARTNEKILLERGAVEFDKIGYKFIVAMHTGFFVSLISEHLLFNRQLNSFGIYFFVIFVVVQLLRYWAIDTLGVFWNTKIIVLKGSKKITGGPYRYFKHPNYIAVAAELAVIPLMFSCYYTFAVFSVLNAFVLARRIRIENKALNSLEN
jgi:methyltransferase